MNQKEIIRSQRLGESYQKIHHPSGLTLLLCPMSQFSSAFALFATEYGSVDSTFKRPEDPDYVTVPDGIAHFLEHKMFECEDGDAFAKYAKTGASANAFTSFDKTAYLFSCTDNFKESLEILLDFVTKPYFTPETVAKEQGIIGQEIRMYDDSPDWQVFTNLLEALYYDNPVKIDIAGTTESIAKIDADLLYRCYHTFYNLHNMVLAVAGNFSVEEVLEAADRILPTSPPFAVERMLPDEPVQVQRRRVTVSMPVSQPLFQIGFKGVPGSKRENTLGQVYDELISEILAGEASALYRRLYDQGLINASFSGDILAGRDYIAMTFGGESMDPDQVMNQLCQELDRLVREGIDEESFLLNKKALYGRYIRMFSSAESTANLLMSGFIGGVSPYEFLETAADVTLQQLNDRLRGCYHTDRSALSVVLPSGRKNG